MKENTEKLIVEYYDIEAGWIHIRLKAGDKIYEERMSYVFDPLPKLKKWLEAIVLGVEQSSFTFDNEGCIIRFYAQRIYRGDKCELSVWEDEKQLEFQAEVERKQLVDAFYSGLINMFDSDEYKPEEWELKFIYEKLEHGDNIDAYISMNRQELTKLLNDAATNSIMFDDWDIPDEYFDYTKMEFDERKTILKELLHTNIYPYNGTSKKEFQSEKIEEYLKKDK